MCKRLIISLLTIASVLCILSGCDSKEESSELSEAEITTATSIVETTESSTEEMTVASDAATEAESEFMRIGEEKYGYIDVPTTWVTFVEQGLENENLLQYSDVSGESVITLQYSGEVDAETAATNVYYMLEDTSEDLTAAMVELDGYEAYQVYGYMPDTGEILVVWCFDGDDGLMHYLAIEGTSISLFDLSETYSLYEK